MGQDALFLPWPALSPIHCTPRTNRQSSFPSFLEIERKDVCFPGRLEVAHFPSHTGLHYTAVATLTPVSPEDASGTNSVPPLLPAETALWAELGPRAAQALQCIMSQCLLVPGWGGCSSGGGVASVLQAWDSTLLSRPLLLSCPFNFPRKRSPLASPQKSALDLQQ